MTQNASRPAADQTAHGAREFEALGRSFDPRDTNSSNPNQVDPVLWSAALEAAAYAVAAAYFFGRPVDGITLQRDGRAWRAQIAPLTTNSQIEPMSLAGIVARRLFETDGDFGAIAESISVRALKARFGSLFVTVLKLIVGHKSIVRAIAGRLVVKEAMSSEELAAHLRQVMEDEIK